MTEPPSSDEAEVRGLSGLGRRQLLRAGPGANDDRELERLVLAQRRAIGSARRRPYVWTVGALAAAMSFLVAQREIRPNFGLSFPWASKATQAPEPSAVRTVDRYVFADGTTVMLTKDAAIEVLNAEPPQPYVRVDHGDAGIHVVHRPNTRWTFAAGPFEVDVVGTTFDLHWVPETQDFFLDLHEGAVTLRGPFIDGSMRVVAGQKISVSVASGQVSTVSRYRPGGAGVLSQESGAGGTPEAIAETHAPAAGSSSSRPSPLVTVGALENAGLAKVPRAHSAQTGSTTWRALVGRGRFAQVISEAQAEPLERCLAVCAAADLRALGDAARYSNKTHLAQDAFLALRDRFPGTNDGTAAAFLLGRTFEAEGSRSDANVWYARYLNEAPAGEFAVEAEAGRARVTEMH